MKYFVVGVLLLLISGGVLFGLANRDDLTEQSEMTEEFILRWLKNDNGTISTYIEENDMEDEDLVQGREALAETLGLLMFYALEKEDQTLYDTFYDQLTNYFLENDGFVNWKINEDGESEVSTNALIDDFRIMDALVRANDKWDGSQYMDTAEMIGNYLNAHNVNNGIYTDFYEKQDEYASENIKLSYIDVKAMETLVEKELLDASIVTKTIEVLKKAPMKNGFYPLSYNVVKDEYTFDENVNIVDQAILAYHFAQVGERSEELLQFIIQEMDERKLVHGMYNLETKEPAVDYESPAVYGYLISYALIVEEDELAEAIYSRMKEFQVIDKNSEYYGGYSITNGNTHIFDNLIPLLAEQEIFKK